MNKGFIAGIAAAALCGAPALAADMPVKAPAPLFNWTGWYGGLSWGVGAAQTRGITPDLVGEVDRNKSNFSAGVQGGYNWQFDPHWVAGVEADVNWLHIDRQGQNWGTSFATGVETDWYATARGRLGYTSSPSLFYVTGGAAFVRLKNRYDLTTTPTLASRSEIANGWTVGGGIETMLGGNWSAKAEYLYIDAGSQNVFNPDPSLVAATTTRFDNRFHVFRQGLNYRFGGPAAPASALPSYNWAGFYVGVNAGTGVSQINANTTNVIGPVDIPDSAFTGGVQAGYNWRFNPYWIAGVEADINWLGVDRRFVEWNQIEAFGVKASWYSTVRARLAYSVGPALLYATGGAAFVSVKNNYDNVGVNQVSKSETANGWTVGGGIEAALGNNWSAKSEYLYINAGSQDVFNPTTGLAIATTHFDNRFHVFRFGLNYKFGSL